MMMFGLGFIADAIAATVAFGIFTVAAHTTTANPHCRFFMLILCIKAFPLSYSKTAVQTALITSKRRFSLLLRQKTSTSRYQDRS